VFKSSSFGLELRKEEFARLHSDKLRNFSWRKQLPHPCFVVCSVK